MTDTLEHEQFLHLTTIEWNALHCLSAATGDSITEALLRTESAEAQRIAAQEFMQRELDDALRKQSTLASPNSRSETVKIETSAYSDADGDRLPLNRWFREIDLAISSRQVKTEQAKTNFLISRLSGKAKEWALGRLVADEHAFTTLRSIQDDLRLEREPPQDESRMRAEFFGLRQGKLSMRDYVQRARHLVSCIVSHPADMASQVHVFAYGMREGMARYRLTRDEPATLEEAFALALREDYTVMASHDFKPSRTRTSGPEPMEIDAVESYVTRRTQSSSGRGRGGRGGSRPFQAQRPITCYRCRKSGHRAAECRAPAPALAAAEPSGHPNGHGQ